MKKNGFDAGEYLGTVKEKGPLVHNITNYVTVNDCANAVLASGASPIMADAREEMEEIVSLCQALVVNIGTLNERTAGSMLVAAQKANRENRPVILDPVGAGASDLRTQTALELLQNTDCSVVCGNISEIKTLAGGTGQTRGVDASSDELVDENSLDSAAGMARELSHRSGAVIVVTGEIDIVASESRVLAVYNGHSMLGSITGTGCMLSCLIGAFCGAQTGKIFEPAVSAVAYMGLAGEFAYRKTKEHEGGPSMFRMNLIDALALMTPDMLREGAKIEKR